MIRISESQLSCQLQFRNPACRAAVARGLVRIQWLGGSCQWSCGVTVRIDFNIVSQPHHCGFLKEPQIFTVSLSLPFRDKIFGTNGVIRCGTSKERSLQDRDFRKNWAIRTLGEKAPCFPDRDHPVLSQKAMGYKIRFPSIWLSQKLWIVETSQKLWTNPYLSCFIIQHVCC